MIMNSNLYDFLKLCGSRYLPALATLVVALGQIWNLPHSAEVGATIMAVTLFLNECLGVSKKKYLEYNEAHQELSPDEVVFEEEEGEADA